MGGIHINKLNKYKDSDPVETVRRLSGIFDSLGFSVVENWIDSGVSGCYSLRVEIENTKLGQNGKGGTKDFARASAYAELYERISNELMYIGDYSPQSAGSGGFYYAPDEEYLDADEIVNENPSYLKTLTAEILKAKEAEKAKFPFMKEFVTMDSNQLLLNAVNEWVFLHPQGYDKKKDFIGLPFYNIKKDKKEFIPYSILRSTYGTNGTCTGNTVEEALVQGLSEVYERYVNLHLITNKLTPPDIPEDYLKTYPGLWKIIEEIRNKGDVKVIVKDCSLGVAYPVVGVILLNRNTQTYRVKFGAHPSFEIALERTLTELFQGTHLKYASLMNEAEVLNTDSDSELNLQNLIRVGAGSYPPEFFSHAFSYPFEPFAPVGDMDNKKMFNRLLSPLLERGYDVLIRDNSIHDFPSFQIVVPGFSEIYAYSLLRMKEKRSHDKVRNIMKHIHSASEDELSLLSTYIKYKNSYYIENTVPYLYGLPLKDHYRFGSQSLIYLLMLINVKLNKISEAVKISRFLLQRISSIPETKAEDLIYIRCIRDYLAARNDKKTDREISNCFLKMYPEKVLNEVMALFKDHSVIFDHFLERSNCWDCSGCNLKDDCCYTRIEDLHLRIKSFKEDRQMDQISLRDVIESRRRC